jgi:hypothetical protein
MERYTTLLYDAEKSYVNAEMLECRKKKSNIGISSGSSLPQSGIGILASGVSLVPLVTE